MDAELLKQKIGLLEKQMLTKLEEIRLSHQHRGIKGDLAERELRTFLTTYLPRRLGVGTGEIVDRNFNTSNQMDVVITSEDHPFTFSDSQPGLFFIEGVCAAGEVKTVLNKQTLVDAMDKARQYKKLIMIPPAGAMIAATNESDANRFYTTPPFFIFAFESQIDLEKIAEIVYQYDKDDYRPSFAADGIFVLGTGSILDLGDGKGTFQLPGIQGYAGMQTQTVLFDFLKWLTVTMPRMNGGSNLLVPYLLNLGRKG